MSRTLPVDADRRPGNQALVEDRHDSVRPAGWAETRLSGRRDHPKVKEYACTPGGKSSDDA